LCSCAARKVLTPAKENTTLQIHLHDRGGFGWFSDLGPPGILLDMEVVDTI